MARKNRHHRRGTLSTANRSYDPDRGSFDPVVDREPLRLTFSPLVRSRPSVTVEDHRLHQPDDWVVPRLVSGRRSRVHLAKPKRPLAQRAKGRFTLGRLIKAHVQQEPRFKDPKYVQICVRRKTRREVLLAKGRGGGGHRMPRRNRFSDVRC